MTASHRGGSGPPLLCLHGATDTWRTWELVLDALEAEHDVFAPTLLGHSGGPAYAGDPSPAALADQVERDMDAIGWDTAHITGNSLGGALALELGARGRARSVVALAPAGGWAEGDTTFADTARHFKTVQELLVHAAPFADTIAATAEGRARSLAFIAVNQDHIPADLVAHQIRGAADCPVILPMLEFAATEGFTKGLGAIDVPVRIVWGTEDALLPYPAATLRFKDEVPNAEWIVLDNVGHCPQLDVPDETVRLILEVTKR
jgi:pimeloyl-ACP methyl ester carboxylesterase